MSTPRFSPTCIGQANQAAMLITNSLAQHYSIEEIAKKVKLPSKTLKAVFKQVYGVGLYTYLRNQRMERAQTMLLEGASLELIIMSIGFSNTSSFCKAFKKYCNETPFRWGRQREIALVKEKKTAWNIHA
jgi:AraC-like DNA-binding protein